MIKVYKKLRILKNLLKKLNREEFSERRERVKVKEAELEEIQREALSAPTSENFKKESTASRELYELLQAKESFLRHKSRDLWLKGGDSNSPYFHMSLKMRQRRNMITMLKDEEGNKVTDLHRMGDIAESFYKRLLGRKDP
ncbi:unnamed protein product [Linum trigynum]|uniref:Uncharacterized protein n=1 Tax=Linum trigynum TaxID=586398 RepID=A0AAV2CHL9_9ROSI